MAHRAVIFAMAQHSWFLNYKLRCVCLYRQSLGEAKNHNSALVERLQAMQTELSQSEVRRTQAETQMRQTHDVGGLYITASFEF